jgi:hypothetical protein
MNLNEKNICITLDKISMFSSPEAPHKNEPRVNKNKPRKYIRL